MTGPSDAAVEALAKHLYDVKYAHARTAMTSWSGLDQSARGYEFDRARSALSKVLPIIREELAAEIEAQRIVCPTHGIPDCSPLLNGCSLPNWMAGVKYASADIVRGEFA